MLTLSRTPGKRIVIGDDIWIKVIWIDEKSGMVKLEINSPPEKPVLQKEHYIRNRIKKMLFSNKKPRD